MTIRKAAEAVIRYECVDGGCHISEKRNHGDHPDCKDCAFDALRAALSEPDPGPALLRVLDWARMEFTGCQHWPPDPECGQECNRKATCVAVRDALRCAAVRSYMEQGGDDG